ncbi:uncharacterized protein PGTG_19639 [Puccinia graminis f. sp. tritici CRL 75-36-700-3]|uniref:Uncharacterized protein n=1 Tax=Puccinia graminis f. sp. tritici (strain CRL 75-36-700-3 / race SCCL) TaxID=418459 RepID=E3LAL1_PUCGT|nr:uncharacterized protein PGTG_19639 [Puccinia graminis f. sp. tritici CRL 75-36-700-3]EFP93586.2 hypothetical protein PGTG_19639 [Puccinia graminis f. sp. tritici CRL 75-36-700-3]
MLAPSHHLALAMSLLTGAWLARTGSTALNCAGGEVVDWNECTRYEISVSSNVYPFNLRELILTFALCKSTPEIQLVSALLTRAIATIVYDKPKNTLDRVSSRFAKLSGNCTILVNNPNREVVTKQQIEAGFKSILDACKPNTGSISLSDSVYVESQNHQSLHDTDYLAPTTLTCGLNSNAPLTVDKDCQDAFDSISVDRWGRLLGDKGKPAPSVLKTLKTCTVLIYTTDASQLIAL